eukprot:s2429_g9.t1
MLRSLSFRDFQAAVVVADPRRLVVNLTHRRLSLSFVVLHVPCVTASMSISDVETWWEETYTALQDARLAPLTWGFVDLNAPLASEETPWFGLPGAEPRNPQGQAAEQALSRLQWHVPSTMQWCHIGSHATWTHPRGQQMRRDYVCCSGPAFELCHSSWIDTHHDGGFAHDDHFPVVLRVSGWVEVAARSDGVVWDPLAFLDPVKCQQFQQALQSLPIPTWDVHIDGHAQLFEAQVLALARQYFVKTHHERQRPKLTERTLNLIQFKRSCLDYGRSCGLMQDPAFKAELYAVEKDVRKAAVYRLLTRLGGRPSKRTSVRAFPLIASDGTCQPHLRLSNVFGGANLLRLKLAMFFPISNWGAGKVSDATPHIIWLKHTWLTELLTNFQLVWCSSTSGRRFVVFVDFRAAFYSVLRQSLFACPLDESGFLVAMHRLGVHPDHVDDLLRNAEADAATRHISPHGLMLLQDVLRATFFQIDGIPEIATTNRGTRPRDPIGDIAFNLLMAVLMAEVAEQLHSPGRTWEGDPLVVHDFTQSWPVHTNAWAELAYVDNLAILLRGESNDQLCALTNEALTAIMQAASKRGLELTYGSGKTE